MISVENFYYVIYTHLLSKNKFVDYFYYPFGTTNLINNYFHTERSNNQCFFYDQEPIFERIYNQQWLSLSSKGISLLANSEHSNEKSKILKEDSWLDWYYFYHGFAAHDWFRDCKYFMTKNWTKPFISFNRLCTGDRAYRLLLVTEMIENNIANQGLISLHINNSDNDTLRFELLNSGSQLSGKSKVRIHKAINRDWIIDKPNVLGSASAGVGPEEWSLWQDAFVHVVTETVFYHEKQHLTEKIFKPIVAERPFMLVGAHKNLEYLRGYGFKTFDRWWSEDYDLETDSEKRISMIVGELKKFISQPEWRLREIHQEMKPILEYNRQHFWGEFKAMIVDELVDNFEICLRQWNNGRVDGREIDLSVYNFDQIKKLLGH
jgi:hypothetical protein